MPERVGSKKESIRAYPVGGEYVLDLDSYLCYTPHGHRTEPEGFCYGCLAQAKELTEKLLRARMYSIIYDHSVINTNDNICENC
jgi:hypothetical protein